MTFGPQIVLVGAVVGVGVLHTIVPDHWVPITLVARQRGWSRGATARAAAIAGLGHVTSTLLIAILVWAAGVAFALRFGNVLSTLSSVALIAFGGWIAIAACRELAAGLHHDHDHDHDHEHHHHHGHDDHGQARAGSRGTALLLILGSSPMVEGIPAFFAAAPYGVGLLVAMAVGFGAATILTYVALCVLSTAGLGRLHLGSFERYGEVVSGAFIAAVGLVFLAFPGL